MADVDGCQARGNVSGMPHRPMVARRGARGGTWYIYNTMIYIYYQGLYIVYALSMPHRPMAARRGARGGTSWRRRRRRPTESKAR